MRILEITYPGGLRESVSVGYCFVDRHNTYRYIVFCGWRPVCICRGIDNAFLYVSTYVKTARRMGLKIESFVPLNDYRK